MIIEAPTYFSDYVNGLQLGPGQNYARTTDARFINQFGDLVMVGPNQPRFDFNGATLDSKGLLMESPSTNLMTYSEFPGGMANVDSFTGPVAGSSFPGSFQGGISFAPGNAVSYAYKNIVTTAGSTYSFSLFVRMTDGGAPTIVSPAGNDPGNDFGFIMYNLPGISGQIPVITDMGGGLYRVSMSAPRPVPTGGNELRQFGICRYAANKTRGFIVTGYQLEESNATSSYMATDSVPVSRGGDSLTLTNAGTLQAVRSREGTLYFEGIASANRGLTGSGDLLLALTDGTTQNAIAIPRGNGGNIYGLMRSAGTALVNTTIGAAVVPGAKFKAALAYRSGYYALAVNGVTSVISTSTVVPSFDRMNIGVGPGWANYRGHIHRWGTYARALSLDELKELTK